jgi:hypothetical protein
VLVGTRASVAVALAQEVIERYPEAFR